MSETTFLSQGVDHLGFLNGQLRGMMGFTALANELIQNADDARADRLTINITNEALIVENNSLFSECSDVESEECSNEKVDGRLCDFHRFRRVSSGNKRLEVETIGAFGIGFTSVYQITDRPQLYSGTRHWTVKPEESEARRIEQKSIPNCNVTQFCLPWARDPQSRLRQALDVKIVTTKDIARLADDFTRAVTDTIMFLKHIDHIEVKRDGQTLKNVRIERNGEFVSIRDGNRATRWLYIDADFTEEAKDFGSSGMRQRKTDVSIALPLDEEVRGLLFAYLPTQQKVGLPFHINADFFPTPDRKHILFDEDAQSEWNRIAVSKTAELLSHKLERLTQECGPAHFWGLISSLQKVAKGAEDGSIDVSFRLFWDFAKSQLCRIRCVYSSTGEWVYPHEAFILQSYKAELSAIPILEALCLKIVHPDLAPFRNALGCNEVDVQQLGLTDLAIALSDGGLDRVTPIKDAPSWIQVEKNHKILAAEIKYLLDRSASKGEEATRIRNCSVAISCGKNFDLPSTLYCAEKSLREIFLPFGLARYFLDDDNPPVIVDLTDDFSLESAIGLFASLTEAEVADCLSSDRKNFSRTLKWLVNESLNKSEETKLALRSLRIWPSNNKLFALDDLVVPGGFSDPLNLASIVDLAVLNIPPDRLVSIGAKRLSFQNYLTEQLGPIFGRNQPVNDQIRDELVLLFAEHRAVFAEDAVLRRLLSSFPIIKCQNGEYGPARAIYYSSHEVKSLIGTQRSLFIDPPTRYPHTVQELFDYLGVARVPRLPDLLAKLEELTVPPPTPHSVRMILEIFVHLGRRWAEFRSDDLINLLTTKKWLPDRNDSSRWFHPDQLHAPYQDYLFSSTGRIVDFPRQDGTLSTFIQDLGIQTAPSVNLVVGHLLNMVRERMPVNSEVYRYLNDHHRDEHVAALKGARCIPLEPGNYVSPDRVFWGEHPFGTYRHRLGPELTKYQDLFRVLEVKDLPDKEDAISVLQEISEKFTASLERVDSEGQAVIGSCWALLDSASSEDIACLSNKPVILDASNRLVLPEQIFFDDFPGMAEKLGIGNRVVARPAVGWQPMLSAGVRFLSEVLVTDMVNATNQFEDHELKRKLEWGKECIWRVAESARASSDFNLEIGHLDLITFVKTDELSVRYELPELDLSTEVMLASAYYDRENMRLYYASSATTNNISREIARSISSETDVGLLASGIKEVLAAGSFSEALSNLDDLGFVMVDLQRRDTAHGAVILDLGDEWKATDSVAVHDGPESSADENGPFYRRADGSSGYAGAQRDLAQGKLLPKHVGNADDGTRNSRAGSSSSPTSRVGTAINHRESKSRSRLLSYVENGLADSEEFSESEAQTERRQMLDDAGVQKVLAFEEKAGRHPEEMQKNFKGYDIKSLNDAGRIQRYIEVKSTSGEWGSYGVKLSASQYEKALLEGDRYWLYVVERADLQNARIYCIQNPAAKVTNYCFDEGWKELDSK